MVPLDVDQELADILNLRAECAGSFSVGGVVAQEMAVFFEVGAATGGIDDDDVAVVWLEHVDVASCQCATFFSLTGVYMQRTAALLLYRCDHLAAVGG